MSAQSDMFYFERLDACFCKYAGGTYKRYGIEGQPFTAPHTAQSFYDPPQTLCIKLLSLQKTLSVLCGDRKHCFLRFRIPPIPVYDPNCLRHLSAGVQVSEVIPQQAGSAAEDRFKQMMFISAVFTYSCMLTDRFACSISTLEIPLHPDSKNGFPSERADRKTRWEGQSLPSGFYQLYG